MERMTQGREGGGGRGATYGKKISEGRRLFLKLCIGMKKKKRTDDRETECKKYNKKDNDGRGKES